VVQRQPWPLVLCGPPLRPRLVATFAIRFPPRKFMIAAAALTTSQVLRNISSACTQMRLRPNRPTHRHPRHPRHPANPHRAWLATGAANREGASQIAGLIQVQPFGWFHPFDARYRSTPPTPSSAVNVLRRCHPQAGRRCTTHAEVLVRRFSMVTPIRPDRLGNV
jgi:hypothetical protein